MESQADLPAAGGEHQVQELGALLRRHRARARQIDELMGQPILY